MFDFDNLLTCPIPQLTEEIGNKYHRRCYAIECKLKHRWDVVVYRHTLFDGQDVYVINSKKWIDMEELVKVLKIPRDIICLGTGDHTYLIKEKELHDLYLVNDDLYFTNPILKYWEKHDSKKIGELLAPYLSSEEEYNCDFQSNLLILDFKFKTNWNSFFIGIKIDTSDYAFLGNITVIKMDNLIEKN